MANDPGIFKNQNSFFELPRPPITPKIDSNLCLYRNHQIVTPELHNDTKVLVAIEPKTCELLTKFLTSQGLPLEAIQSEMFQNLFHSLNPAKFVPSPAILKKYTEKLEIPIKHSQRLSKATGPLSVTIDVVGKENGDNYLAFSIHFFEGLEERKCLINLKKLLISGIKAESILAVVRRAISIQKYDKIEISNFVVPNKRMFELFKPYNDVIELQFISFHHYLGSFAESILNIREFSTGIETLRRFVALIKTWPEAYDHFRRCQMTDDESLDFPDLDDQDSWCSTAIFLTRCLILHPTFETLVRRRRMEYITEATFGKLTFLYQVLQKCIKHARDLFGKENSISQIIPSIMSMRNYIFHNLSHGYTFESEIRKAFSNTFQELTSGQMSRRYDMATLLDPRFAYDNSIYPNGTWSDIEKAVIEEKDNLENLILIAREYLACPAVSIDAQQFFGSGGKFSNLVEIYDSKSLESYLNCAGHYQQFLGHGSNIEQISDREIAYLNLCIESLRKWEVYLMERRKHGPSIRKMYSTGMSITEEAAMRGFLKCPRNVLKEGYSDSSNCQKGMNIRGEYPNKILEIDPEDVKLKHVDLEDIVEEPKQPEDSIEKEIKPDPSKKRKVPKGFQDSIVPIQKESKPLDVYALEDVKLEFEEEDPVEIKLEQMDYPYTLIEKEHTYQNATPTTEDINPKEELFDDNDEPLEMKPDVEELNYGDYEEMKSNALSEDVNLEPFGDNYGLMKEELEESWSPTYKEWALGGSRGIPFSEWERRVYPPHQLSFNRRCISCEILTDSNNVKNVTIDNEKLFILLGSVLGNRLTNIQAREKYYRTQTKSYYCRYHFQESCLEIFKELDVETPEDIASCPEAKFERILELIAEIRKLPFTFEQARQMLVLLVERYSIRSKTPKKCIGKPKIVQEEENEIIPKAERVPRKQKFEKEPEATIRIIETVPFKLPDYSKESVSTSKQPGRPRGRLELPGPSHVESEDHDSSEDEGSKLSEYTPGDHDYVKAPTRTRPRKHQKIENEEDSKDDEVCRFCSEIVNKTKALKSNKNWIRLSEWNKYLGVNFVKSLDYKRDDNGCKKHFGMTFSQS